jgi:hypothetical protein
VLETRISRKKGVGDVKKTEVEEGASWLLSSESVGSTTLARRYPIEG